MAKVIAELVKRRTRNGDDWYVGIVGTGGERTRLSMFFLETRTTTPARSSRSGSCAPSRSVTTRRLSEPRQRAGASTHARPAGCHPAPVGALK